MTALVIAGHHRSGTSLLAQILHRAGLHIGDELMPGAPSNPFGHFEDMEVVRIHKTILDDNGYGWQLAEDLIPVVNDDMWQRIVALAEDRETKHRFWGFKDPRVTVFIPLWKHVLPEARIVAVYRHPSSCVESIRRRAVGNLVDQTAPPDEVWPLFQKPDLALRLWAVGNRGLLRAKAAYGDDVILINHEQLMSGGPIVDTINRQWTFRLDSSAQHGVVDVQVVSASIAPLAGVEPELRDSVEHIWHQLIQLSTPLVEEDPSQLHRRQMTPISATEPL